MTRAGEDSLRGSVVRRSEECWACKGTGSLRFPDDCGYCRGEGEVLPEVNEEAQSDRALSDVPNVSRNSTLVPNPTQDIYAYDVSEHDMSVDREIDRRLGK